jgi:hypothetical protein
MHMHAIVKYDRTSRTQRAFRLPGPILREPDYVSPSVFNAACTAGRALMRF